MTRAVGSSYATPSSLLGYDSPLLDYDSPLLDYDSPHIVISSCLNVSFSPAVPADVVAGSGASTLHQFQSVWRAFQRFPLDRPFPALSSPVVLASVSHMFHVQGRSASTVSTYVATLDDPSWCHFRLPLDDRFEALLRSGLFLPHPPTRRPPMFWSRRLVLPFLRGPTFASPVSALVQLRKAFFWWIWRQFYVLPSS